MYRLILPPGLLPALRCGGAFATLLIGCFPLWMPFAVPFWVGGLASDKILHLGYSLVLGFSTALSWKILGGKTRWLLPSLVSVLAGCEIAQYWMPNRSFEWLEVGINAAGGLIGAGVAAFGAKITWRVIQARLAADARLIRTAHTVTS